MGKKIFVKGDHVAAKTWQGEEFLGIYDYTYTDGLHCVMNVKTNKRFCVKSKDIREANNDEEEEIKKILKEKKIKLKEMQKKMIDEEFEAALASTEK
jgi:hypothetical protein